MRRAKLGAKVKTISDLLSEDDGLTPVIKALITNRDVITNCLLIFSTRDSFHYRHNADDCGSLLILLEMAKNQILKDNFGNPEEA